MSTGSALFFALFNNLAIFIALVALYGFACERFPRGNRRRRGLAFGVLFGFFAIGCMYARIPVAEGVIVDQRNAVVALSGIFGGPLSALVSALMAGSYRGLLGGEGVFSGIVGVCLAAGSGICAGHWLGSKMTTGRMAGAAFFCALAILPGFLLYRDLRQGWELLQRMALPFGAAIFFGIFLVGLLLIRERRRETSERAREAAAQRLQDLALSASDWFWEMDQAGRLTYLSERFFSFMGDSDNAVLGRFAWEVSGFRGERMEAAEWSRILAAGEPFKGLEVSGCNRRGEPFFARISGLPTYNEEGRVSGFRGTATDISAQKHLESSLRESALKAQAATIAKSQFIANMSHEIRTPMNGIVGMAQLLEDTDLDADQEEFLGVIAESAESLMTLLGEILDYTKLDAHMVSLETVPFDFESLCEGCLRLVGARALEKGVEVVFDYAPELPRIVLGDALRWRQIVLNLLGNAVKFTQSGKVVLRVSGTREREESWRLAVEVEDTGMGVPAHLREAIFEEFTQADVSDTRAFGGTGLGLSIVRRLVELMGGTVECSSTVGMGSTFSVRVVVGVEPFACPPPGGLEGVRVFLFSGSADLQEVFGRAFEHLGASVERGRIMDELLPRLSSEAAAGRGFDFLIIDHGCAGPEGLELATRLGEREELRGVRPILLVDFIAKISTELLVKAGFLGRLGKVTRLETMRRSFLLWRQEDWPKGDSKIESQPAFAAESTRRESAFSPQFEGSVLVVDDVPSNAQVAQLMLERLGVTVATAEDGQQALFLVSQSQQPFHLILMDCKMPGMDGFETTIRLRQREASSGNPRIPVVAYTANVLVEDQTRCLEAGMDGLMTKPFSRKALQGVLSRWLRPVPPEK